MPLPSEPTTAENQALRQTSWKSQPAWNRGSGFLSPGTFYIATGQDKPLSLPDILLGAHKLPDICVHVSPRATRNRTFCRSSSALLGEADILFSACPKKVRAKRVITWPVALCPRHGYWGVTWAAARAWQCWSLSLRDTV